MDETSEQIEEYLKKNPHSSVGSIEQRRRWLEKRVREDEQKRKVRAEKKDKTDTFESLNEDNEKTAFEIAYDYEIKTYPGNCPYQSDLFVDDNDWDIDPANPANWYPEGYDVYGSQDDRGGY